MSDETALTTIDREAIIRDPEWELTPAEEKRSLRAYLSGSTFPGELAKIVGSLQLARRMARVALTLVNGDDKLANCDIRSVAGCVMELAEIGLEPGRDAYLYPKGGRCIKVIKWQGYKRAARSSGEITRVWANVIRENDLHEIHMGSQATKVIHSIASGNRGDIVGAYACAEWADGTIETIYKDRGYLDKVRDCSDDWSKRGAKSVWGQWHEERCCGVMIKRICEGLPLGPASQLAAVISADESSYIDGEYSMRDEPDEVSATPQPSKVAALAAKLEAKAPEEPQHPAEEPAPKKTTRRRVKPEPDPDTSDESRATVRNALLQRASIGEILTAAAKVQDGEVAAISDVSDHVLNLLSGMSDEELREAVA